MRVALIQPPSEFLISQSVHPNLGLMYISSALKAKGIETVLCDLGLGDEIPEADVFAVTGTTPQLGAMLRIIADLYADQKRIVVGGCAATLDPQVFLDAGAGVVVRGEGELALPDLLSHWPAEPTIVRAPHIMDLNALPFPDRSQAWRYHYYITDRQGGKHTATTLMTARGCPFRCGFCSHAIWGNLYRARSAENVLAELRELKEAGWDSFHAFDDTLTIQPGRLKQICHGLRPLGMTWRCFIRSDGVTPEILDAMTGAGCVEVGIGLESGSQKVLAAIDKGETVEQQRQAILAAKRAGLRTKCFVILGLPGEDWSTIQETIDFLRDTQPDDIDAAVLSVLPGSPIHADPARYGIELLPGPVTHYKGKPHEYACGHRTSALSPEQILTARAFIEAQFKRW